MDLATEKRLLSIKIISGGIVLILHCCCRVISLILKCFIDWLLQGKELIYSPVFCCCIKHQKCPIALCIDVSFKYFRSRPKKARYNINDVPGFSQIWFFTLGWPKVFIVSIWHRVSLLPNAGPTKTNATKIS